MISNCKYNTEVSGG